VAENCLRCLSRRNQGKRLVLIWDVSAAHRGQSVQAPAEKLSIGLIYIPAGQTDDSQPLDLRIFGPMKQRARDMFGLLCLMNFSIDPGMDETLTIMVSVWMRFQQDDIPCGWDHLTQ
jgi:hypothetical protein